jgi:hypothetical protein
MLQHSDALLLKDIRCILNSERKKEFSKSKSYFVQFIFFGMLSTTQICCLEITLSCSYETQCNLNQKSEKKFISSNNYLPGIKKL